MKNIEITKLKTRNGKQVYAVQGWGDSLFSAILAVCRMRKEKYLTAQDYFVEIGTLGEYKGQAAVWLHGEHSGKVCALVSKVDLKEIERVE